MKQLVVQQGSRCRRYGRIALVAGLLCVSGTSGPSFFASAQNVSGVRSFDGGVGPLFNLTGPGSLYLDGQGTQCPTCAR